MPQYRNPVLLPSGFINCEIHHETYGWIPFTCDPNDRGATFDTKALYNTLAPLVGAQKVA